jgi:hypothetical protein
MGKPLEAQECGLGSADKRGKVEKCGEAPGTQRLLERVKMVENIPNVQNHHVGRYTAYQRLLHLPPPRCPHPLPCHPRFRCLLQKVKKWVCLTKIDEDWRAGPR